jgi:hypothetical protein
MGMKFALRQSGWSIEGGRTFIPQGAIIDSASTDPWSALVVALGITMPPMNAQPLTKARTTRCGLNILHSQSSPCRELGAMELIALDEQQTEGVKHASGNYLSRRPTTRRATTG